MSDIVRFSVSIEADLLEQFDRYCADHRLATRSEAVRQMVHETLNVQGWAADAEDATATLTLVYDHHRAGLTQKLTEVQHHHPGLVVSAVHVHLDHDHCLEVIILRGRAGAIRDLAHEMKGLKGIHTGHLVLARTEAHEAAHGHSHGE